MIFTQLNAVAYKKAIINIVSHLRLVSYDCPECPDWPTLLGVAIGKILTIAQKVTQIPLPKII